MLIDTWISVLLTGLLRKEDEDDDVWNERRTSVLLREEEEYELYGQFYFFRRKDEDNRPSTIKSNVNELGLPDLYDFNESLLQSFNITTYSQGSSSGLKSTPVLAIMAPNQTIQDQKCLLDRSDSELNDCRTFPDDLEANKTQTSVFKQCQE